MTIFVVAAKADLWLPVHYSPQGRDGGHVGAGQLERTGCQVGHQAGDMLV